MLLIDTVKGDRVFLSLNIMGRVIPTEVTRESLLHPSSVRLRTREDYDGDARYDKVVHAPVPKKSAVQEKLEVVAKELAKPVVVQVPQPAVPVLSEAMPEAFEPMEDSAPTPEDVHEFYKSVDTSYLLRTVKYVDSALTIADKSDIFRLKCNMDYELTVKMNWVWFKGYSEQRKVLPMINCAVMRVPILFMTRRIITAHQQYSEKTGMPKCMTLQEYMRNKGVKKLKSTETLLYGFCPEHPRTLKKCLALVDGDTDEDDVEMDDNKLTTRLMNGELEMITQELKPVNRLRQYLCAAPLVGRNENTVMKDWGFFL